MDSALIVALCISFINNLDTAYMSSIVYFLFPVFAIPMLFPFPKVLWLAMDLLLYQVPSMVIIHSVGHVGWRHNAPMFSRHKNAPLFSRHEKNRAIFPARLCLESMPP